jgi:hypothetical protein
MNVNKATVLFVATILMLSTLLAGCPPPLGRRGGRPPHPPIPGRR